MKDERILKRKARPVVATPSKLARIRHYGKMSPAMWAEQFVGTRRERARTVDDLIMEMKGWPPLYDTPDPYVPRKYQTGGQRPTRADSLEWNTLADEFAISNSLLPPNGRIDEEQRDRMALTNSQLWRHVYMNPLSSYMENYSDDYPIRNYSFRHEVDEPDFVNRPFSYGALNRLDIVPDARMKKTIAKIPPPPRKQSSFQDLFYDDIMPQVKIHTDSYGNTTEDVWHPRGTKAPRFDRTPYLKKIAER